jgi:thiol-disulfide isomerase/thioredoxin
MSTPKSRRNEKGKGVSRGEIIVGLVILFLVVWGGYSLSQPSPPSATTTQTTSTPGGAPDFTLPVVGPNGLTGQKISLSSFRGKVVFLEFMEPWCPHCQAAVPALEKLYQQFGPQNVVFLVIAGPNSATVDDTAKFIANYHSTLMYVYDSSGTIFATYGVQATPAFFLIDKKGTVANTYTMGAGDQLPSQAIAADITRLNT